MAFVGILAAIYIPFWTLIALVAFTKEENLSEKSTSWKGGGK